MPTLVLFLCIFFGNSLLILADKWDCVDYYWRDYHGKIPEDAVPAGNDHDGNPLYIGLVYIRNFELLPATIFPKLGVARTTAYSHIFNTKENVKILCSPHKNAFVWISIHSKDLKDYYSRTLVNGGSEVGENLYIGRVFRNNDVTIGKIFRDERSNRGIWFVANDKIENSLVYELLEFDCDKKYLTLDIDIRQKAF